MMMIRVACCLLLFVCALHLAAARAPGENSFGISFGEALQSTGLGRPEFAKRELTSEQVALLEQMKQIFELDEELEDQERELLERLGARMPDARDKNQLRVMSNLHLKHRFWLDKLLERLGDTVAAEVTAEA